MPRGAVARMAQRYPKDRFPRVGFLGTVGSRKSGVYKRAVEEAGYTFVEPTDELQARITSLIYDDVKGSGELNLERYESVLRDMLDPAGPCACDTHRAERAQRGVSAAPAAGHRRAGRAGGRYRGAGRSVARVAIICHAYLRLLRRRTIKQDCGWLPIAWGATHNLFYMDGVRRTYGVIVRCCFASSLRFVFRRRFRIRRFVGIRRLIHFIRIGVC